MRAISLTATVAFILVLGAAPAQASHVRCGDTLTKDTKLDSDLVNCPSNGVVIGADGITLDLNGHRIDGDGTEFEDCPRNQPCDLGVFNDSHDGVTIRNGSTRGFAVGVLVARVSHNRVVKISSSKNDVFGAFVTGSTKTVIRDGSFSHNVAPMGDGIGLFSSDRIEISGNSIQDNPGPGIHVSDSSGNLIERNRMGRNGPSLLIEGDGNEVRHNRVDRGAGILLGPGDDNVIVANRVSRAQDSLAIENGSGNRVVRNVVVRALGDGIRFGIGAPSLGGGHNVARRNVVKRSAEDGFHVFPKDGHSVLKQNVAIGAGGHGFEVQNPTTTLTANRAERSALLGIRVVPGVVDGGGNVARDSGDPRQCANIACG